MASESWTGVVQKTDEADAELEQESQALAAVEEELTAAEARAATAEVKYNLARRQVAKELAKPLVEEPARPRGQSTSEATNIDADAAESSIDGHVDRPSKGSKNAGAMTDKEVSRDRWLAKKNAEKRVQGAAKKCRERLRRYQRDKKFESLDAEALDGDGEQAPKAEAKPAASQAPRAPDLGLGESAAVKEGAQGIAERLKNHPDAAAKRTSLVKVLVGDRENVYTFELSDIVTDLKERGLVDASMADDVMKLLKDSAPAPADKSAPVPPEEWLAHAQKISSTEPLDKALNETEKVYLKWLEDKRLAAAEAELKAAEATLQAALNEAEVRYPRFCKENGSQLSSPQRQASAEPEVDLDVAARLEEMHDSDPVSRGSKNTSALSEKVVGAQKWEDDRGKEARAREKEVKAREARRTEARDRKMDAADAPIDG